MKDFGRFLSNLRSSMGLSLEDLANLVESSRSTLSRIENSEIPQPFKGTIRKLVISLGELLCTSIGETERYLTLAGIDRSLLTEIEEVQLGLVSFRGKDKFDLERLERIYQQRLHQIVQWTELNTSRPLPELRRKAQECASGLREIQVRLNKQEPAERGSIPSMQIYREIAPESRLVVGYQYGKDMHTISSSNSLYTLASSQSQWLMDVAGVDRFAVDDCILLTKSDNFEGWEPHDIKTTILDMSLPAPDDVEQLRRAKLPEVEKNFFNSTHYRFVAYTPMFTDRLHLEMTLAPLSFYDYFSLTPFLDEPLLAASDGSKQSIRQKYGSTALTYSPHTHDTCLIPAPVNVQGIIVTSDRQIILMQRSRSVAVYPGLWSASFEETMNAPGVTRKDRPSHSDDGDLFACAIRGVDEEFAIPADAIESIKILSLDVEYLVLAVGAIAVIKINLTADEVKRHWMTMARDSDEASKFATLSTDLNAVVAKLFSGTVWHPTARMRLIQFLFHTYGVDEVATAIQKSLES